MFRCVPAADDGRGGMVPELGEKKLKVDPHLVFCERTAPLCERKSLKRKEEKVHVSRKVLALV